MSFGKLTSKQLMDTAFGKTPYSAPANFYVSLHTGDPGQDGQAGNEATGSGYARASTIEANWNEATDADPSVTTNASKISFSPATGDWSSGANMTHAGLWRSLAGTTEADYLGSALLGTPEAVTLGGVTSFAIGTLQFDMGKK